jgi:hypothetical protein
MIALRIPSLSKGAMMNLNCPSSKKVTAWTELPAIRHPDVLLDLPFKQGEQLYLLELPIDHGELPFLQTSSWSKSILCLMTQMQWKITSSRGRLKTSLPLPPVVKIQIPCTTMLP